MSFFIGSDYDPYLYLYIPGRFIKQPAMATYNACFMIVGKKVTGNKVTEKKETDFARKISNRKKSNSCHVFFRYKVKNI